MTFFHAFARVSYLLTLLVSAALSAYLAKDLYQSLTYVDPFGRNWLGTIYEASILLVLMVPITNAVARRSRGGSLLPTPPDAELAPYLRLVTGVSVFAHILTTLAALAVLQIILEKREGAGGIAFFALIAIACYVIALWIGEFILVHERQKPA